MPNDPVLEKAASNIGIRPIFEFEGREIHVACIVAWSPPLIAEWWRGKAASIIGADINGKFVIRHCDGTVLFWEHSKHSDTVVAKSVKEFAARLREDKNDTLSWWRRDRGESAT